MHGLGEYEGIVTILYLMLLLYLRELPVGRMPVYIWGVFSSLEGEL